MTSNSGSSPKPHPRIGGKSDPDEVSRKTLRKLVAKSTVIAEAHIEAVTQATLALYEALAGNVSTSAEGITQLETQLMQSIELGLSSEYKDLTAKEAYQSFHDMIEGNVRGRNAAKGVETAYTPG
ncbi:MAG: hypothetical protein SFT92_00925 [Rickettsiales bacterium]|nr:hypothetical protein [Rickettsiales bacterium]